MATKQTETLRKLTKQVSGLFGLAFKDQSTGLFVYVTGHI